VVLGREEILVYLFGGGVALEPQETLRVPHRRRHINAVETQCEDADFRRNRDPLLH
jgi:hypothetical protein